MNATDFPKDLIRKRTVKKHNAKTHQSFLKQDPRYATIKDCLMMIKNV